jgi:pSer/pThr/pTyr-binding forkhead associated (FHA) protein
MKIGMLSLLSGVDQGKTFLLKNLSVFEGGRSQGNHVLIKDPSVAMSHFRICRNGEEYTIYDLGARTGTRVQDRMVEKVVLKDGDEICVGGVEMRFNLVDESTPGRLASCAPDAVEPARAPIAAEEPDEPEAPEPDEPEPETGELDREAEAARHAVMGTLDVVEGEEKGRIFELGNKPSFSIGRSNTADLRLRDSKVSRVHCYLELVRDHFVVIDNNSSNGTIVNGERVLKTVLKDGDYIRLGFTILRFRQDSPSGVELPV